MHPVRQKAISTFHELRERLNRARAAFNEPVSIASEGTEPGTARPWSLFSVREDDQAILFHADLPGWVAQDFSVRLRESTLHLTGRRNGHSDEATRNGDSSSNSVVPRSFARSFLLPATVDPERIRVEFRDGSLDVRAPKHDGSGGKVIPVHAETAEGTPAETGRKASHRPRPQA